MLKYAIQEFENDKRARAMLFEELGIPADDSTSSQFEVPPHPYALSQDRLRAMFNKGN